MNVAHVITRLTLGGASENTVGSIVALDQAGYRCTLAVGIRESDAQVVDHARRRGCRLVDVPSLGREVRPGHDVAALVDLVRRFVSERPVIVHTHTSKAGFIGRLAARLARVPAVIHQPHGHVFYGYWGARRTAFYIALERLAARWTDRIITLTEPGTEEHLARGIGRREQYVAVPSGVPTEELRARAPARAAARQRLGLDPRAFVVVAVGRFVPVKGFDVLVAAMPRILAHVPDTRLVLVGDGPDRAALEAQAAGLGVADRLHIAGATDDVTLYLAGADVLAAPSRNEGMGRVLVEAMALGVPAVGSLVGGISAVIADGKCGRLVPPDSSGALADALVELGRDAMLRTKFAEAAIQRAEAFSRTVADAKLASVYASLLAAKGLR